MNPHLDPATVNTLLQLASAADITPQRIERHPIAQSAGALVLVTSGHVIHADALGTAVLDFASVGQGFYIADQLIAHAVGDYILQSDWMASQKTCDSWAAAAHVLAYSIPFLLLRPSLAAWSVIVATHFVIDRWRLARFVCWAKNWIAPPQQNVAWAYCTTTGYPPDRPAWLTTWLLIIADNTLHVLCNAAALRWLP